MSFTTGRRRTLDIGTLLARVPVRRSDMEVSTTRDVPATRDVPTSFAKWVFRLAGIYGIVTVAPLYFLEGAITRATGPISHPEYFYGFVGLCLVWQMFFLMISRDPSRWRSTMPIAVLEKFSFSVPVLALYFAQRVNASVVGFASVDLLWAALFVTAFLRTSSPGPQTRRDYLRVPTSL